MDSWKLKIDGNGKEQLTYRLSSLEDQAVSDPVEMVVKEIEDFQACLPPFVRKPIADFKISGRGIVVWTAILAVHAPIGLGGAGKIAVRMYISNTEVKKVFLTNPE